jgi:hypothetical protein
MSNNDGGPQLAAVILRFVLAALRDRRAAA